MHDIEHPPIHDLRPMESSVKRRQYRTVVRTEAISAAIERRTRLIQAFLSRPGNADVSFFDEHPGEWDFAAAVQHEEQRRAAGTRRSAKRATG